MSRSKHRRKPASLSVPWLLGRRIRARSSNHVAREPCPTDADADADADAAREGDFDSTEQSLISLFNRRRCSNTSDLTRIHARIIKTGFTQHVYVAGRIISFCCSVSDEQGQGSIMDYACPVFEEIQFPDGFLYSTM